MDLPSRDRLYRAALGASVAFFVLLSFFVWLPAIGGSSEAREGQVVRAVVERGEFLLPLRNGIIPSKPPLFHWSAAAVAWMTGGVTPSALRLTSLFYSSVTLWVTILLGARLAPRRPPEGGDAGLSAGLVAGAVLGTTYLFVDLAGDARVDAAFTAWVTCAVAALLCPLRSALASGVLPERRLTPFYLFCGGATLTKGPLGIVLPLVVTASSYAYVFGAARTARFFLTPRPGWAAYLAVTLPWYLFAAVKGGGAFVERQLLFENVKRMVGDPHMNSKPFWFYLPAYARVTFPWGLPAVYGAWHLYRDRKGPRDPRLVPAAWAGAGLVLFSLADGKRSSYLSPLLPAVAVVTSAWLSSWWETSSGAARERLVRWVRRVPDVCAHLQLLLLCGAGLLAGPALLYPRPDHGFLHDVTGWASEVSPWYQCVLAAAAALPFFLRAPGGDVSAGAARLALCARAAAAYLALAATAVFTVSGVRAYAKGFDRMAAAVASRAGESPVAVVKDRFDEVLDPFMFYFPRPVVVAEPHGAAAACGGLVVSRPDVFARYGPAVGAVAVARAGPGGLTEATDGGGFVVAECKGTL